MNNIKNEHKKVYEELIESGLITNEAEFNDIISEAISEEPDK